MLKHKITLKKLSKSKLDNGQLQAMIVAIGKGESDKVKKRLPFYNLTKEQQAKLDELMSDKKEEKTNGVLGIIDELNSIEVPTDFKKSNN